MRIGKNEIKEILIVTDKEELIVSITDKDIVGKSGYKVVCVPSD